MREDSNIEEDMDSITTRLEKDYKSKTAECRVHGDESTKALLNRCFAEDDNDIVSIRCRRHKKRFNVPRAWTETCAWLCPQCYGRLSSMEREKYMPSEGFKVDIRPKENDRPTMQLGAEKVASSGIKSVKKGKSRKKRPRKSAKLTSCHTRAQQSMEFVSAGMSPSLVSLLPKWRIVCKKCKRVMPVHRVWIDNTSKVLCPECYCSMTEAEVQKFHSKHADETAVITNVSESIADCTGSGTSSNQGSKPSCFSDNCESDAIAYGGRCSVYFITHATDKELIEAVKKGRVSKTRARIEFNRRKNKEYFNDIPDVTTYQYCKR